MFPIDIRFRNMPASDFVYNNIYENAEKLEQFCPNIISCHVVVSAPHKRQTKGKHYHVWIYLTVPGKPIVVNRDPDIDDSHEDAYIAIRDAFEAATRQLEDYQQRRRGHTKHHELRAREMKSSLKDMESAKEEFDIALLA